MTKNFKKPEYNQGKKIKIGTDQGLSERRIDYPVFSFKYLVSPHSVNDCTEKERAALINQLANLSQFTWAEIAVKSKRGMGAEKIPLKSIKAAKPSFLTEDVKHLMAFRFSGKKPFVGHLDGSLFHIIYIDNKFSVYNHGS